VQTLGVTVATIKVLVLRQFFKVTNTSSQQLCYETDFKKTKTSIHQSLICMQGKRRETLQQVIQISFI
jgi:hypothetical protein